LATQGDVCTIDEDGYLFVVDRVKDMVNVSGFKVFTRQLDDVLIEYPDIEMAATIGLPDPNRHGSEIVASAILLKAGVEKSEKTKENIINYLKERVAPIRFLKESTSWMLCHCHRLGKFSRKSYEKQWLRNERFFIPNYPVFPSFHP